MAAADARADRGEHAAALAVYREQLKADPADIRLWMRVADCEVALGNRVAAIAAIDEVARLRPDLAGVDAVKSLRARAEALASGGDGTAGRARTSSAPIGRPVLSPADVALARRAAELILEGVRGKPASEQAEAAKRAMGRLAPALLVPDAADAGVWRIAGLCALATGDDDLAALAFEAIGRLRPDYHAEPALLDLMATLDARPIQGRAKVLRALAPARAAFNHQVSVVSGYAGPDTVASWLGKAAEAGSPEAMVALAIRLVGGWGIEPDQRRSVELLERAYEAGSMHARVLLGLAYGTGRGTDEAKDWALFERLVQRAKAGEPKAMEWAGRILLSGRGGIPKDEAKSVEWSRKAAEAGDAAAMNSLGAAYAGGWGGLAKDESKAVEWYRMAAEAGNGWAMHWLGVIYINGSGVQKDAATGTSWLRRSAEAGNPFGMASYGGSLWLGIGVVANQSDSMQWFRMAAEVGHPYSMFYLGNSHAHGRGGLPKNEAKAVEWYLRAADAGDPAAMNNLGVAYADGQGGLAKDESKAVEWYRRAAEAGAALAMTNLGRSYANGQGGLAKDEAKAVEWFRKAAEAGDAAGMTNLGVAYGNGQGGLPKDEAKASKWRSASERVQNGEPAAAVLRELGLP